MEWFETAETLTPLIRNGDTQQPIKEISRILQTIPETPYHAVLHLEFTNDTKHIANHFDKFIRKTKTVTNVGAIYVETNGFEINTDRWYVDGFAYTTYGGHDDYDWLSNWDSDEHWEQLTLTGLEALQAVYENNICSSKDDRIAKNYASLLIVAKFQDLMRRSVPHMKELNAPLLATSHEFDFVAEFRKSTTD